MAVFDLDIQELGPKADGIHSDHRGVVYVDRALPGDRIAAFVRQDAAGLNRGEIVRVLQRSPHRQQAPCVHYEQCGNCTLQHVTPSFYREWKLKTVADALTRVKVQPKKWIEPVFLGGANRRRATFASYRDRGHVVMGYYRRRSKQIGEIDFCLVADPKLLEVRDAVRPFLASVLVESGWPADVFLQLVGEFADMAITGPVGGEGFPDDEAMEAIESMLALTPVARVHWRANETEDFELILEKEGVSLEATFGPIRVALPPMAFLQPTADGEKLLQAAVMEALPATGSFADLFSGCGTFSGPMLERGSVDAFEASPLAVRALSRAAGPKTVKVNRRDLFTDPLQPQELDRYDAVVFDPPRGGCPEQATMLAQSRVPRLVGVSCNPATFARDARILAKGGYELTSIQIIDQFVGSHHVEMVGVYSKRTGRQLQ